MRVAAISIGLSGYHIVVRILKKMFSCCKAVVLPSAFHGEGNEAGSRHVG